MLAFCVFVKKKIGGFFLSWLDYAIFNLFISIFAPFFCEARPEISLDIYERSDDSECDVGNLDDFNEFDDDEFKDFHLVNNKDYEN